MHKTSRHIARSCSGKASANPAASKQSSAPAPPFEAVLGLISCMSVRVLELHLWSSFKSSRVPHFMLVKDEH